MVFDARESTTDDRTEEDSTEANTATRSTSPADATFSVSSTVLHQRTDDAPPEVRLRLHNDTARSVTVRFGSAIFTTVGNADLPEADSLALDPESYGGYDDADSPNDGCWRRESRETPQSMLFDRTISAGEPYEESYLVFTAPDEPECYPPGTYRFEDQIEYGDDEQFGVALVLTVAEDGTISTVAEGPIPA